jgi:hypothetical protein
MTPADSVATPGYGPPAAGTGLDPRRPVLKNPAMDARFNHRLSAYEARAAATRLAFAPFMFQAARCLVKTGLLARLRDAGDTGLDLAALNAGPLSPYAVRVLLDAGLACGVVAWQEGRYTCTTTGWFLLEDDLTRVNLDFTHSVCWQGLHHLDEALAEGRPAGLRELGPWPTIYAGLKDLPAEAKHDWFAFDHYYSDHAFPAALPLVFGFHPKRLLDVGGNTGRFAIAACAHDPAVRVTIADLPGQLAQARPILAAAGVADRVEGHPVDLLDPAAPLPTGYDAVWMSQFLCCFAEDEIVAILRRATAALAPGGAVFILDTFWDRQRHEAAAYALVATSLYFTVMANGNSRMYHSADLAAGLARAGLAVVQEWDDVGLGHTLWRCQPA